MVSAQATHKFAYRVRGFPEETANRAGTIEMEQGTFEGAAMQQSQPSQHWREVAIFG